MDNEIRAFVGENIDGIKRDIKRLVDIKSVKGTPKPGMPYGEDVHRVKLEAMKLCEEIGMAVTDCDGKVAYAHYGRDDKFIAIVAHVDVVPEGGGWDTPPYDLTERDGYLVGRGTLDDKGPFVIAAWAVKYLIENKIDLNYGIRIIIGLDEESGMSDIEYYNKHCTEPLFSFTPDSDFPVGHGEKGIFEANLISEKLCGTVRELCGGVATNVVSDFAKAKLDGDKFEILSQKALSAENIKVCLQDKLTVVEASGKAAHAGNPYGSVNANYLLMKFLRDSGVLVEKEQKAAEFMCRVMQSYDGKQLNINCDDGIFAPLTMIGGMLSMRDGAFVLNVNSRYPTAITPDELEKRVDKACRENDFSMQVDCNSGPFYLEPTHTAVKILCDIYNEVTNSNEKPYVMSGGTYARMMNNAVSYGIEFPGQEKEDPEWVGAVHMKNEALKIERAKQSCEIFINTLIKLQNVKL
ncbi:MAG: Sapep family Mn(2+)-dependent dipeptidase [Oscillospiraceae bacterium]